MIKLTIPKVTDGSKGIRILLYKCPFIFQKSKVLTKILSKSVTFLIVWSEVSFPLYSSRRCNGSDQNFPLSEKTSVWIGNRRIIHNISVMKNVKKSSFTITSISIKILYTFSVQTKFKLVEKPLSLPYLETKNSI